MHSMAASEEARAGGSLLMLQEAWEGAGDPGLTSVEAVQDSGEQEARASQEAKETETAGEPAGTCKQRSHREVANPVPVCDSGPNWDTD